MNKKITGIILLIAFALLSLMLLFGGCSSGTYDETTTTTTAQYKYSGSYAGSYDSDDDAEDDYYTTRRSTYNYNSYNTTRKSSYSYSYSTTSAQTYKQDDPYYRANDYNNDGKLSQEEFQGAVNDWMDAHGY